MEYLIQNSVSKGIGLQTQIPQQLAKLYHGVSIIIISSKPFFEMRLAVNHKNCLPKKPPEISVLS
jgi:hypothetical protein